MMFSELNLLTASLEKVNYRIHALKKRYFFYITEEYHISWRTRDVYYINVGQGHFKWKNSKMTYDTPVLLFGS